MVQPEVWYPVIAALTSRALPSRSSAIPGALCVKAGYVFAGWNTAADGSGGSYAGSATLTMGAANVTPLLGVGVNPEH